MKKKLLFVAAILAAIAAGAAGINAYRRHRGLSYQQKKGENSL